MSSYLDKILEDTKESILLKKKNRPYQEFFSLIKDLSETRGFVQRIRQREEKGLKSVIAESKQASPSQGLIRKYYNPSKIAESYIKHNATCMSVLTDEKHFLGSLRHLEEVNSKFDIPLLRKDFIVDEYQIYESRASGADCILLIVAALSDQQLKDFYSLAEELGMDVLVEVHDEKEVMRALDFNPEIIGINNRNLKTFEVDLLTSKQLAKIIPKTTLCVSESGIKTKGDVEEILSFGISSFLVGESFMRSEDPGTELNRLFNLEEG